MNKREYESQIADIDAKIATLTETRTLIASQRIATLESQNSVYMNRRVIITNRKGYKYDVYFKGFLYENGVIYLKVIRTLLNGSEGKRIAGLRLTPDDVLNIKRYERC